MELNQLEQSETGIKEANEMINKIHSTIDRDKFKTFIVGMRLVILRGGSCIVYPYVYA